MTLTPYILLTSRTHWGEETWCKNVQDAEVALTSIPPCPTRNLVAALSGRTRPTV